VLRIRDVYPGSRIRIFSSRIPNLHQRIQLFLPKKFFLSSRKYDPGCSSRIRIPDSEVKKAPDPGSGSATLYSQDIHRLVATGTYLICICHLAQFLLGSATTQFDIGKNAFKCVKGTSKPRSGRLFSKSILIVTLQFILF
jgi:hypothetical protein